MLCGGEIDKERTESYRAVRTLPGQESLENLDPVLENGWIRVGSLLSSRSRFLGSLPGLYLLHRICIKIIRTAAGIEQPTVSLLTLISLLIPTAPASTSVHPLSNLDGDALATIFNSPGAMASPSSLLATRLNNLPPEIMSIILSFCGAEYALATAAGLPWSFLYEVIRDDIARQRIVVGIQATRLLHTQPHLELYTERTVKLSSRMTAIFVELGGVTYLQDVQEATSSKPKGHLDFSLDTLPHGLALQVDHLGVRNIAFHFSKSKIDWLRDGRTADVFMDKWNGDSFPSIRIVSDALKIRMIDLADGNSVHPRALLPPQLGKSIPYSVTNSSIPYLQIPGYFQPFYTDLCDCTSVYLTYNPFGGISGVFSHRGEEREEIFLGSSGLKSVKLYGLRRERPPCEIAFIQFETSKGSFQPTMSTLEPYSALEIQKHSGVKGLWWREKGEMSLTFYCNVVF